MHAIENTSHLIDNFPLATSLLALLDVATYEAWDAIESIDDVAFAFARGDVDSTDEESILYVHHVIASALAIG